VGFSWWSLGALTAAAIVVGQLLRLGPHLLEVPISAMLVLGVGAVDAAATDRVVETLVGAGVGAAVNLLVPPAEQSRTAEQALEHYAEEIVDYLRSVAEELERGPSAEDGAGWADGARALTRHAVRVERALEQARESRRLNPRALGRTNPERYLASGLEALEYCTVAIRTLVRILAEGVSSRPGAPDLESAELRSAFALLLRAIGGAVRAFTAVVRSEAESEPDEDVQDEDLADALEALVEARMRLSHLVARDARHEPRQWQLHDAVLASVERVLRELDAAERIRLRSSEQGAIPSPAAAQAIRRLRSTTRHLAEGPLRNLEPPRRWPPD
jgi:uncharacterized membrane protein YgaE (UPF0421/DUF939 family)